MQNKILELLLQEDEITWQTILLDLVSTNEIDPWNIDISLLANKYLEVVQKMQEANLFISGKVLLASAILLKIKAERLLTEGIAGLDMLMFPPPEEFGELDQYMSKRIILDAEPKLTIKTPQTRKRKVNVNDLISALEKALEVNERRLIKSIEKSRIPEDLVIPEKPADITKIIKDLYQKITLIFSKQQRLTFSELVGSDNKRDKIATFIPLLHLDNQQKVDLHQEGHFQEIYIHLPKS